MRLSKDKLDSLCKIRDKSGSRFYEFSTSWWALFFFFILVFGCVLWNQLIPFENLKFDPYPFNGLRTVLALMGAIQTPLLLLYSRKSTDYRKHLLEQDFELEKKIFKKIEIMEREMRNNHNEYIHELKYFSKFNKKMNRKRNTMKINQVTEKQDFISLEQTQRDSLQAKKTEKNENMTA
ncbi:DUF1003 domain-containing protein [Pigmentibacter ruber]|uniref:DUF1003 domain-containing protein n=1 Tax=Pigmentibacter ruber TaxID=2683196 RepID=UPI00131E9AC9|nr:DUF1003 domain-containing protein [Pigmentibacter ruber]BFD30461.1 hypothetical protein GTC16762_00790 [Pigmentibacter ruber]